MLQLLVGIHYLLFCRAAPVSSKTEYHQRSAARAISILGYNTCEPFYFGFYICNMHVFLAIHTYSFFRNLATDIFICSLYLATVLLAI